MKKTRFILSAIMVAFLGGAQITSHAETTKERWVAKKKAEIDRQAEDRMINNAGGTAGRARKSKKDAEEWKANKYKELEETASKLGDGKK